MKLLLKNGITPDGIRNLLIENDRIAYIGDEEISADEVIDLTGKHVLPAMIDPHVHVRDLTQAEKEDWTSASNAALKGGIATVFDMPNTLPPTVNSEYLNLKRRAAGKSRVKYKFNLGVTNYNLEEVRKILDRKPPDISALKLFLAGSSANEYVEETEDIKRIFDLSAIYDIPVMIHTEIQKCIEKYALRIKYPGILTHNYIRNRECANIGTELVIRLAKEIGNRIYIVHTSTSEEIQMIRENKNQVQVYCEVTPHHLLLNEQILETVGNYGKVNPPLRTLSDNEALWEGIRDGTVDTIGTDHAPHTLEEKNLPYTEAPSGFPGLETALPLLLNEVRLGKLSMQRLVRLTSKRTAEIFGLDDTGALAEGKKADLVVVDMNRTVEVKPGKFATKARYSPFEGMPVVPVEMTFVDGKLMYLKNTG